MLRRILRLAAIIAGVGIVLGVGYVVMFALFCCRESPRRAVDIVNGVPTEHTGPSPVAPATDRVRRGGA